jgi:uncharacterized protein YqjF (DUF2071 family)
MSAPTESQRLLLRGRPAARAVGRQRWSDLLFLHWRVDPRTVQATLPPGLFVDTFAGAAYVGVVPFRMQRVRPIGLPPLPWLSWFLELNVRTYVHDGQGGAGVWFYSLDCNQPVAVALARRFFHLPYEHAAMHARSSDAGWHYRSRRRNGAAGDAEYAWGESAPGAAALPGSLEFFLVERYLLFARDPAGTLHRGRVHHPPYRIHVPRLDAWSKAPLTAAGFNVPGAPVSVLAAQPVDVTVHALSAA